MESQQLPLQTQFLEEFIYNILVALHPEIPEVQEKEKKEKEAKERLKEQIKQTRALRVERAYPSMFSSPTPRVSSFEAPSPLEPMKKSLFSIRPGRNMPRGAVQAQNIPQPGNQIIVGADVEHYGEKLKYLIYLLADPSTFSVECTGPGKPLIVNKSGKVEIMTNSLTTEEIDGVMKEISTKTKIPLTSGLFKTLFESYMVTAVISEFVGTRFLIQKVHPQVVAQPLPGVFISPAYYQKR